MKEQLQHIFQNGYPGSDVFIDQVIKPIFSDDIITDIDIDIIDLPEKRRRADTANILSAVHVADIDRVDSDPIALYDVTLKPGSKIEHSRVEVKQFIASEVMTFTHAFILFHYDNEPARPWRFSYVYKERSTAATRPVAKRYTYVFGKDYRSRTAIERFIILARSPKTDEDFAKAFSVETLSDEFFDKYRELYADFVQYITGKRYVKESGKWVEKKIHDANPQLKTSFDGYDKLVRDYIKKMFGRIVFLYFLQRKGWLAGNRQYMHDLFYCSELQDNFLDGVLEPLFFGVLNTRPEHRSTDVASLPDYNNIPYLNGGLFQQDEIDERTCILPADYFKRLFDFFDQYNFTIDENDPEDAEVGIDPEMLGRIFENLLEDNKDKGAFYTPKEIVEYMCRESIIAYLLNGIPERSHNLIRNFVETLDADSLNNEQRKYLAKKLVDVKICDPAIGSGAFPMGIVNILSKIYIALGLVRDRAKMKRHIMEQNIYGVDIEKGAVDIARLRFWLAMVVDATEPEPLPNLHFKIMQGNSLLETYEGFDLTSLVEPSGDRLDFIWSEAEAQMLQNRLAAYYGTTDHHDRDRIAREIHDSVMRQLLNAGIAEEKLVGLDPSSTEKFFLWHTWFADVFKNGGFDIVIGNPPYVDSETMTKNMPDQRNAYKKIYRTAQGNWDLFIVFIELGISLLKDSGIFSYIIPNKLIAAKYANACRELIQTNNLIILRDYGTVSVFDAAVYPCVIVLTKETSKCSKTFAQMKNLISTRIENEVNNEVFSHDSFWDKFFIEPNKLSLIFKISDNPKLSELEFEVKGAATVAEAYLVKDVLTEKSLVSNVSGFNLINTGTIDKYKSLWGIKRTQYIKTSYNQPFIAETDLMDINPVRLAQSKSNKLIVAGMSSCIEALFDDGSILAGKSTSIVLGDISRLLKLLGVINSKLMDYWLNINFNSLKMAGGYINVGVNEISALPIAELALSSEDLEEKVKQALVNPEDRFILNSIDQIVYHLYNLTYDEVLIIDPKTTITREEYENNE